MVKVRIQPWFVLTAGVGLVVKALRAYLRKRPKKRRESVSPRNEIVSTNK